MSLYFSYWGKAGETADAGDALHLLPYHSLDVAALGLCLLEKPPSLRCRLAELCQINASELQPLLCLALALHDLGKFSTSFSESAPGPARFLAAEVVGQGLQGAA